MPSALPLLDAIHPRKNRRKYEQGNNQFIGAGCNISNFRHNHQQALVIIELLRALRLLDFDGQGLLATSSAITNGSSDEVPVCSQGLSYEKAETLQTREDDEITACDTHLWLDGH